MDSDLSILDRSNFGFDYALGFKSLDMTAPILYKASLLMSRLNE